MKWMTLAIVCLLIPGCQHTIKIVQVCKDYQKYNLTPDCAGKNGGPGVAGGAGGTIIFLPDGSCQCLPPK